MEGEEEEQEQEEEELGEEGRSFGMYFAKLDKYGNGFKMPGKEKQRFCLTSQVEEKLEKTKIQCAIEFITFGPIY